MNTPSFSYLQCRFLRPLTFAIGLYIGASALAPSTAQASDAFLDAQDAFRRGNGPRLAAIAPKLKGHPLSPYVEYYQLRMQIEQVGKREIDAFIERYNGDYLTEALRADWLRQLARRERWDAFYAEYPRLLQPDGELKCMDLSGRRQRQDPALKDEAVALWRGLPELGDACHRLFTVLFDGGVLPESEIWQRARQQFELGRHTLAKQALGYLPKTRRLNERAWSALNNKPESFLNGFPAERPLAGPNRELVVLAVQRLARSAPETAARQLKRLAPALPAAERGFLWGQIASQAAYQHQPGALQWYALADPASLSDEQQRWAVRAALREGDWPRVSQLISAMPPPLADEPAWIYWQARALRVTGRPEAAVLLFERIAAQPTFYGVLAAEELGRRADPPAKAAPVTPEELAEVSELPALRRSLALFQLDQRVEAVREWSWGLKGMSDRQLLAAAELAKRQRVFDRAISTAEKTQKEHDYSMRYLAPYDDKVRPAAKLATLDDAWVYGLMRQESRFITGARSSVGAQGLMQIMPATAKWVAKKLSLKHYHPSQASEIDTNVLLGTTYLRLVYENLDRHPVLASAAYNAGPSRAKRWRDPQRTLEGAIYTESIPFAETRDYVKKVLTNAVFYTMLLNGRQDSLKARLGVVSPVGDSAAGEELP
jgi:soluble lytic murein transglycosylase